MKIKILINKRTGISNPHLKCHLGHTRADVAATIRIYSAIYTLYTLCTLLYHKVDQN